MLSRLSWHRRQKGPAPAPRHALPRPVPAPPPYREPELDGWMRWRLDQLARLAHEPLITASGRTLADWLRAQLPAERDLGLCRIVLLFLHAAELLIEADRPAGWYTAEWAEFLTAAEQTFGALLTQLGVAAVELSSFDRDLA